MVCIVQTHSWKNSVERVKRESAWLWYDFLWLVSRFLRL